MFFLVLIVFLTIVISATCSLLESVLYSSRMGTLIAAQNKDQKRELATKLIHMKKNISEPIAAILVMNTLANTAGATMGGMVAVKVLGVGWMTFFSIALTLGILFLAEIFPKTIGAMYWKNLWPYVVHPLSFMQTSMKPIIKLIEISTSIITGGKKSKTITEEELVALVNIGASEGEISKRESAMVKNIIGLEDRTAGEILTPRTVVFVLDEEALVQEARKEAEDRDFTRILVYRKERENIIGYVTTHDLNQFSISSEINKKVKELVRPIHHIKKSDNCLSLLTDFLHSRRHISVVDDDYSGFAGIVTLEDLLETLLGIEIVDEKDSQVDMQKLAQGKVEKSKRKIND